MKKSQRSPLLVLIIKNLNRILKKMFLKKRTLKKLVNILRKTLNQMEMTTKGILRAMEENKSNLSQRTESGSLMEKMKMHQERLKPSTIKKIWKHTSNLQRLLKFLKPEAFPIYSQFKSIASKLFMKEKILLEKTGLDLERLLDSLSL